MTLTQFLKSPPILYGQITVNGRSKIGKFVCKWNFYSNNFTYHYYTYAGNKGTGGFTLARAYKLFTEGWLTTNEANGNPSNYI